MANARPDRPTSFEGGAAEGEEDDDSNVDKSSAKEESLTSNNKQNGVPHVRNVDRYGFMGGDQYTSPDEIPKVTLDIIRKREVKWVEMFENWEKWMTKRFKRVRARCRKGIPPSLRARAWQYLCGSKFLMDQNQGKFEEYLHKAGDPKWIDDIHKDLHRQFPLHEIFALRGGHGQEDLFRILKAYTIHNPQDGYCQAQGPIAAVLLMHMPAEQAFWCLVSICEKYLPGYYSPGLEAVHIDGDVLFGLLKKSSPVIYKHLKKQKIEPILYMTEWFMCVFSRTLPWTAVLRVWDMFFCEGVKVMFRIALVLFKLTLGTPEKLAECPTLYETMEKLRHIPHEIIDGEFIAKESLKLNVDEKDMEKEHQHQITKRRNLREKAQSSAKTETQSSKKKRKEKQLENEQKEKKHDSSSLLTFRKLQNKLLVKETHKENVTATVSKPVEDEPILLSTSPVSKNESPSPKKMGKKMVSEMEIAKILAEEAFTAKMQQTVLPVSVEDEQFTSDTTIETSETKSQQAAQSVQLMAQTYSSDAQLPISDTERPLLESAVSFGENQLEESNMLSTDGNQLQKPGSLSEQGAKLQLHYADTHTATVEQQIHSYQSKGKKAVIDQIDLAVKLEPGELLTLPTSKIRTRSQSPSSYEQRPYSDEQLTCQFNPDIPRNHSSSITEATPPSKTRSKSPSHSGHLSWESVNDPVYLDKTQYLNHTATSLTGLQVASESMSSGEDLETLFVNPLSIEPENVEQEQIQHFVVDDIQNDTSHAKQQVECFDDQNPNKDLTTETISGICQQALSVQPQEQSLVEQSMTTKQPVAFNQVNMHIVLETNKSTTACKIETPKLKLQNQKLTAEPVIVKSQKVLHSKKTKPKHSLAAGQPTLSSRPLSTEIVKIKPQKLASNLQMAASSISLESAKISSKQSVPLLKELAIDCLLIKTQVPLRSAEAMSERLKQLSLSAPEVSSSHMDFQPKEYPLSEEKQPLHAPDTIEKECFIQDEDPKATADNLVGERSSEQIEESAEIMQTSVSEQLVQQLSWQTVQHSNEDATLIPAGAEVSLPLNYDSTQMRETHI